MRSKWRALALVAGTLVLASLAVGSAPRDALADVTTVSAQLNCVAHAPIIGDQPANQAFSVTTDAPATVQPGQTFSLTATTPVSQIASQQDGGTVSGIKNLQLRIPVPANSTFVSASLSGGLNIGSAPPTVALQGSATTGTIVLSVPGPIPSNQNYQLPALTLTLTASGPDLSTIQPRIGGTGTTASTAGFITTAIVTSPISAEVETDCYPAPPNPAWSTTTIVPNDTAPPAITLNTPADGAQYPLGSTVAATYQCNDGQFGSGVATCQGDVPSGSPIDTSTLGPHTFTVTASDENGNVAAPVTHTYDVVPPGNDSTPPTITLSTPADGATYQQGTVAGAAYACNDDGSGITACTGDVANGTPVDTATLGAHTFTVTATDGEGNTHTVVHSYQVTPPPTQQNWTTGDVTNRMPVGCDTLLNSFHESIPVSSNRAPTLAGEGTQFEWSLAVGMDEIPTLNNATNLIYRWKKPTNGRFVSVAFTGPGYKVNGATIGIRPDGTLQMNIASVTDQSFLGFGADQFYPPPFKAVVEVQGSAGALVQNMFDYFQITTITTGFITTTQHCPAGDAWYNGRANVPITTTTIVDDTPPTISVTSPGHGQTYAPGADVPFTYSCADDHGTPTCTGDVPSGTALDTSTSGAYVVHVTSVDTAGNTAAQYVGYTVADPTVSVADAEAVEGPGATLDFAVTLSNPSNQTIDVEYATADGTATQPDDYTNTVGTLTFAPGDPLTKTVSVPVHDDQTFTGDRDLALNLVSALDAAIADGAATGTIVEDDPPPVSVADAAATEGPGAVLDFAVTLAADPNFPVAVDYATSDGSAAAPGRYTATSGTLVFDPGGPLTQHVLVPVVDDAVYNGGASSDRTQTMFLNVVEPANGYADGATGTITDDDVQPPLLGIGSAAVREGDAYVRPVKLAVTLNKPSTATITVKYTTAPGTAFAGSDFKTKSGTLTFKPGVVSKPIGLVTLADTAAEPDESFTVKLSVPTNALIANDTGTVTIRNDDSPPAAGIEASVGDASLYEGPQGKVTRLQFVVSLNRRPTTSVTVQYAVQAGSALAGSDVRLKTGTLTFSTLQVAKVVTIVVVGDAVPEADESFSVVLSNPSAGLTIVDATGAGTILDDD
jgi:hypothetical protein